MGAFSAFKDKSKRTKVETPTVSDHYLKLAHRTAVFRYVCLAFAVVFIIYSLSFHSSEITINNFRYMLKFINLGDDVDSPTGDVLVFDGSSGNKGLTFKGDLAVLNESGLSVTGWDGEVIQRVNFASDHPKIAENGINLFCYDLGGKTIKIFNSYSLLSEISLDYPVYWFSASKQGSFAVVSSAKGYRSAVYVYDKEFRLIYSRLFGDKYVEFVDISENGKEFITAANYSENGDMVTLVTRFSVESENALSEQKFVGEIPLGIYYTQNGYCLLTSDNLRFFDKEGALSGSVSFLGKALLSGEINGDNAIVTYKTEGLSGGTEVFIYNSDGSVKYSHSFENSLTDVILCENKICALSPGEIEICDFENISNVAYTIPTSYSSLISDGEKVILFSENKAEFFTPDKFPKKEKGDN